MTHPSSPAARRNSSGFTLAEFLLLALFVLIAAATAAPNVATAVHRKAQKQTMGDMKTVASALEAFQTDTNDYPQQAFRPLAPDSGIYASGSQSLTPDYVAKALWMDGWGKPMFYGTAPGGNYILCSRGADYEVNAPAGAVPAGCADIAPLFRVPPKPGTWPVVAKETGNFDCDIAISNGQFVLSPEGNQQDKPGCVAAAGEPPGRSAR